MNLHMGQWEGASGQYRYIRNGKPGNWLTLSGEWDAWADNWNIRFKEYNASGRNTGSWTLHGSNETLSGTFLNPATKKSFKINLKLIR